MKLIFKARDITEANIVSGLLKSNGIESHVGGYYLQGGIGDLAAMDFATINVADEDAGAAITIIDEYESTFMQPQKADRVNKIIEIVPYIVIVATVIMMLLLAIAYSDYR